MRVRLDWYEIVGWICLVGLIAWGVILLDVQSLSKQELDYLLNQSFTYLTVSAIFSFTMYMSKKMTIDFINRHWNYEREYYDTPKLYWIKLSGWGIVCCAVISSFFLSPLIKVPNTVLIPVLIVAVLTGVYSTYRKSQKNEHLK